MRQCIVELEGGGYTPPAVTTAGRGVRSIVAHSAVVRAAVSDDKGNKGSDCKEGTESKLHCGEL